MNESSTMMGKGKKSCVLSLLLRYIICCDEEEIYTFNFPFLFLFHSNISSEKFTFSFRSVRWRWVERNVYFYTQKSFPLFHRVSRPAMEISFESVKNLFVHNFLPISGACVDTTKRRISTGSRLFLLFFPLRLLTLNRKQNPTRAVSLS